MWQIEDGCAVGLLSEIQARERRRGKVPGGEHNNTDIATTSFMLIRRLATFRPLLFRLFYRPEGQVGFRWQPADEKTRLLA
ncbi:hypothetical protein A7E78_10945 [Syntrophotalea acetylenivorans]|uniref:Uncharacterized protein n=1 Tax=Syntrophotalea acetylenivorans TaxID=1842532 RepID=A0A1L3GR32_9BACT|nr:hypothetical protein A7E78_10945 [Syntrophotalea acetylenivorans]